MAKADCRTWPSEKIIVLLCVVGGASRIVNLWTCPAIRELKTGTIPTPIDQFPTPQNVQQKVGLPLYTEPLL